MAKKQKIPNPLIAWRAWPGFPLASLEVKLLVKKTMALLPTLEQSKSAKAYLDANPDLLMVLRKIESLKVFLEYKDPVPPVLVDKKSIPIDQIQQLLAYAGRGRDASGRWSRGPFDTMINPVANWLASNGFATTPATQADTRPRSLADRVGQSQW